MSRSKLRGIKPDFANKLEAADLERLLDELKGEDPAIKGAYMDLLLTVNRETVKEMAIMKVVTWRQIFEEAGESAQIKEWEERMEKRAEERVEKRLTPQIEKRLTAQVEKRTAAEREQLKEQLKQEIERERERFRQESEQERERLRQETERMRSALGA